MANAAWSYSRIKSFEQCPKKFYHLKVAKDYEEPETSAMGYGTAFHLAAEEFIRDGKPVSEEFNFATEALEVLNAKQGKKLCERKMGLTRELKPCDFFSKDVWWRGIVDLLILDGDLAWVVDYKTGKSAKYADKGQLELMALATFKHFPTIKTIRAGLLFVVSKDLVKATYRIDEEPVLWDKWFADYARMETAFKVDVWNPRPSGFSNGHCVVIACIHHGDN